MLADNKELSGSSPVSSHPGGRSLFYRLRGGTPLFTTPAARYSADSFSMAPCPPSAANHPFYPWVGFSISEKPGSHLGQANDMGSHEPLFFWFSPLW